MCARSAAKSNVRAFKTAAGWRFAIAVMLLLSPLAGYAAGQAGTTAASIVGQVKDNDGGVLPGVMVKATSPALQVPEVVVVTDERGEYRLTSLPLGTYTLEYELTGFQTLRQTGIEIRTPGFVATLNQVMALGSLEETVTVSGASPVVDVRTATVGTNLTQQAAALIPSTRDGLLSYVNLTPSVRGNLDVGGAQFSSGFSARAYGQTTGRWSLVEGVMTTNPRAENQGQHFNFDAVEAVRVQGASHSAEVGTHGVMIDTVYQSGGNSFHGQFSFDGTGQPLRSDNIDDELRNAGVIGSPKLHPMTDLSLTLGGKIIQDKLWFFAGGRYRQKSDDILGAFYPDGSPATWDIWQSFGIGKLSYQPTPRHRFIGFYQDSSKGEVRGASALISTESMVRVPAKYTTSKIEWQATVGQSFTLSVLQGHWFSHATNHAVGDTPRVARLDLVTQRRLGDVLSDGTQNDDGRNQTRVTASWFRPDLFAGDHEFKAGFDYHRTSYSPIRNNLRSGNYQLIFENGVPFAIDTFNYPVNPENRGTWAGFYVQDKWTVGGRLTLDIGVRYDHDNAWVPEQCRSAAQFAQERCFTRLDMATWSFWAPRIMAAYDLFGDARTVVKASYGRYMVPRSLGRDVATFNPLVNTTTRYRWRDLNGDRDYTPGEVDLAVNGPDIISTAAGVGGIVNPDLKAMTQDQLMAAIEREVMPNVAVRVAGFYGLSRNTVRTVTPLRPYSAYSIPITRPDPGPDGVVNTADDPGVSLTYWDYPAQFRGAQFDAISMINDPNADATYRTIEIGAMRRLSGGWQWSASYSATLKNEPVPVGSAFNPNAEINTANNTWEWMARLSSSYEFPKGIIGSVRFEHRSGTEEARQVLLSGGQQVPRLVVNAEAIGSSRLPSSNLLDLQARKRFRLPRGYEIDLRANISNVLNVNPVQARVLQSGATYLLPTEVLLPRIVQFGAQISF